MLRPPVGMALARDEREIPGPDPRWSYEPKFDGWRAAVFTAAGVVQSRRDNDLAARFPEVVEAVRGLGELVLDGELVALREGRLDFGALTSMPRARAAAGIAVYYIAFDLLADGAEDLRPRPYRERRDRLERRLADVPPP
ncbi:MAG TPA: ATP-dependent DNA ligase, partial [Actinophytocola sp.]|nr:ATP-dependent DNA ligase [Actinophytocola sp.]